MSRDSSVGRAAACGMENRIQANPGAYRVSWIGYLGKAVGMLSWRTMCAEVKNVWSFTCTFPYFLT